MTEQLRRALTNSIRLLRREAAQRRLSIEGGAREFDEDARLLAGHLALIGHQMLEDEESEAAELSMEKRNG